MTFGSALVEDLDLEETVGLITGGLFSHYAVVTASSGLAFDNVVADTDGFATGTGFVIPGGLGAPVLIIANVPFSGSGGNWALSLLRNGSPVTARQFGSTTASQLAADGTPWVGLAWIGQVADGDSFTMAQSGTPPSIPGGGSLTILWLGDKPGAITAANNDTTNEPSAVASFLYNTLGATIIDPTDGVMGIPTDGVYVMVNQFRFTIGGPGWSDANYWDCTIIPFVQSSTGDFDNVDSPDNHFPTQVGYGWADMRDYNAFANQMTLTAMWFGRLQTGDFAGSILIPDVLNYPTNRAFVDTGASGCAIFKIGDLGAIDAARTISLNQNNQIAAGTSTTPPYAPIGAQWSSGSLAGAFADPSMIAPEDGTYWVIAEQSLQYGGLYFPPGHDPIEGGYWAVELLRNGTTVAARLYSLAEIFGQGYDQEPWVAWVGACSAGDTFTVRMRNQAASQSVYVGLDDNYIGMIRLTETVVVGGGGEAPDWGVIATGWGS